jgi:uracil-DNA glycosylase
MANASSTGFDEISTKARACRLCADDLPLGPRPIFQIDPAARILIAGQAPGRRVHETGVPFDDPSGERLRAWMGVDAATFYDQRKIAILPMGFCYPGPGKSGDLPPRPECAVAWRSKLLDLMPAVELTLLIGQYAIEWRLKTGRNETLTRTVQNWKLFWPALLPLPHPSPRNNIWLKKNPWFDAEIVPMLRRQVISLLKDEREPGM